MEFRQGLPTGSIVGGDYRIIDVLGQGGFGLTYKGFDTRLNSTVAIKEYFPADMAFREAGSSVRVRSTREEGVFAWGREKFLEEARTLARFRHKNIVRVARLFEENHTAYMVLDFEEGPSLAEWRAGLGRPPRQDELDRIASLILDAVEVVHTGGILHRDIKPQNIIMRGGVEPVLIDFGAARASLGQRSKTVHAIVTPGYSPKEQYALDVDRQGAWSDIYALGATLYFLVTGHSPPDALTRDLESAMPMEPEAGETYRESFLSAVDIAMQVRAEDRPQSIDEWRPLLFSEAPTVAPAHRRRREETRIETVIAPPQGSRRTPTNRATGAEPRGDGRAPRNVSFDEIGPPPEPPVKSRVGAMLGGLLSVGALAAGLWYYAGVHLPARDDAAWRAAEAANTTQAYDAYLAAQPVGRFAPDARARRQRLAAAVAAPPAQPPALPPIVIPQPPIAPPTGPVAGPQSPVAGPQPVPEQPPQTQSPPLLPPPEQPAQPPTTRPPASTPRPPMPARALPDALPQAELERLQQTVTPSRFRLVPISTQRVRGFSEQHADFAAELERLSGGRLTITAGSPDDIGGSTNILREAARNQLDFIGWHSPVLSAGRRRAYWLFAGTVPFGLAPADHVRWLRADGARLLEQTYARDSFQVRVIPCGIAGGPGAWFRREIRSPNDFRGLKTRAPGLASDVLQRLGATAASVQNTELVAAFGANTVDAVLDHTARTATFVRTPPTPPLAAAYHFPSWHSPSYLFEAILSPAMWSAMPQAQQRLVDEACRRNLDRWATQFESTQTEVLTQIRNARIAVRPFTGPTLEALRKAATDVLTEEAARSPDFKEVLDSYNRFRR